MKWPTLCTLIILLLCKMTSANAVIINAGETELLAGTTTVASPNLAGSVLRDEQISDIIVLGPGIVNPFGAQIQNRVYRSSLSDTLIFANRFSDPFNATLDDYLVDSITISGFSDFLLDVDYRVDGPGDRGPTQVSRSLDGNSLVYSFFFPLVVGNLFGEPQEQSYWLPVWTEATEFSLTGTMEIEVRHLSDPFEDFTLVYHNLAVPVLTSTVDEPNMLLLPFVVLIFVYARKHWQRSFNRTP